MTKLKNTKKGMAKKALSISLVAAMLATSNVPVWAAEDLFSDGSTAVEAPVVEEPAAEVEMFSSEPAEDTANSISTLAVTDSVYGYTADIELKEAGNGWKDGIVLAKPMTIKDNNGNAVPTNKVTWTVRKNGYSLDWGKNESGYIPDAFKITTTHDDFGATYDVYVEVTLDNGETIGFESNKIVVSAVDISALNPANLTFENSNVAEKKYTGREIKLDPDTDQVVNDGNGFVIDTDDLVYTYSGDLVNYTGKDIIVTGVVKKAGTNEVDPAYTGYVTGTYQIVKRDLSAKGIIGNLKNPDIVIEYSDELAEFTADDVKLEVNSQALTDSAKDITYAIESVIAAGKTGKADGTQDVIVTLDTSKLTNFNWSGSNTVTIGKFKIAKRNLDNVTATLKRSYSVDELRKGALSTLTPSDFTFTDKDGKVIKLGAESITIALDASVINQSTSGAGTYAKGIKITGNNAYCENGPITADVVIVQNGLANGKFENAYATAAEEFAGEGVAVTKDTKKLGNFVIKATDNDPGYYLTEGKDYEIEYENNTHASTKESGNAKLIVKGIGIYAGSEAVFEFEINQAPLKEVKSDKKEIVYNPDYSSAADYLNDIVLTVTADNKSTTNNTTDVFTLKDTEYTITNLNALKNIKNELKGTNEEFTFTVSVEANKDAAGNYTGNYNGGVKTTETITVCKKSLSSEDVKVTVNPDSYVYTGSQIVPEEVIVTDGDTVLEEGTDYELVTNILSNDAVDAGTAKITVRALANGKYKPGSTATGTFTITPASIEDVHVEYAGAEYTGQKHADATKVTLKLGDIDVTDDFNISFPSSKNANINAGETAGSVIITATAAKAKNYSSRTRTAAFEIEAAELTGDLKVYDEAGRELNQTQLDTTFKYDGTFHTFGKEKFTGTVSSPKKVTENDYEITYVDNSYGKMYTDGKAYGVILVTAKGNYKGTTYSSSNGLVTNGVYTDANGKKYENVVDVVWFAIEQAGISASNISVNNGVYAGGYTVKPNVVVTVNGRTLIEGQDYELDLTGNKNLTDVTTAKTLTVTVKPINGYKMTDAASKYVFSWGIDKFNFANADILVSGTDADPVIKVMNGSVLVDEDEYDLTIADGKVTVTATEGNKNYEGSKTVDIETELERPETPQIARVEVNGNKATVVLEGECDGATGYDFVISTNGQSSDANRLVNKNILGTKTTFQYLQQGIYWAHCHAWKRVDGVKVFSEYSQAFPFSVTSITPEQPVITSMKKSGRNLTVTWTKCANATGYDIVMGTAMKKVNGENRPVEYGKAVKKITNGNTVTVTFKSIPKGTYYVGLHSYNRTSETGVKVFSPWSNAKKVTF